MVSDSKHMLPAVRESHRFVVLSPNLIIHSHSPRSIHLLERPDRYVQYRCDRNQHASRVQVVALTSAVPTGMQYYYFEAQPFYHKASHKQDYLYFTFRNQGNKHRVCLWSNLVTLIQAKTACITYQQSHCETQCHFGSPVISLSSEECGLIPGRYG